MEITAEPYLAPSILPALVRQCPRIKATFTVQFDALDDSVAEIFRGLAMRLGFLAERIERRAECEVR